jgi:hypothetical protein
MVNKMKKEYWIKIGNVDNRLVIFLNGEMIWDSGIIHNDPKLHKAVELTLCPSAGEFCQ